MAATTQIRTNRIHKCFKSKMYEFLHEYSDNSGENDHIIKLNTYCGAKPDDRDKSAMTSKPKRSNQAVLPIKAIIMSFGQKPGTNSSNRFQSVGTMTVEYI